MLQKEALIIKGEAYVVRLNMAKSAVETLKQDDDIILHCFDKSKQQLAFTTVTTNDTLA